MASRSTFDYIIIGNGLAGLQLALKMASDDFFSDKHIGLIDPSEKTTNDKTWSFWEPSPSQWDAIVYKSWDSAKIHTTEKTINLNLAPFHYKSIRAIDFYKFAKAELNKHAKIHFIIDNVVSISESSEVIVKTNKNSYKASHVFDSRIPEEFYNSNKCIQIIQHFKGIVIKSETDVFDANTLTMMDYRLKDGQQTTFTYVLPFSKNEALIEFTYFTENSVDEDIYDSYIKTYINEFLKIERYEILESEIGEIPMTTFPFDNFNSKNITKIGTGGGWVKPSTGYSFKHTEKKVAIIIENLKANKIPSYKLFKSRFRFYDKVFLKVLKDENHKGEWIFQQFYNKNTIETMFRFLDEESSVLEEFRIMKSLFSWSFIKAFFKTL
ncbi:lycopene cyclase family protein [Algibacter sp. 2305UL17-15]|uniref:lycopene cyclase family protein n=1 Tax=Algibacter sp. 2305UL17-15 TaxID=3231268 RepID=UPI0034579B32